MTEQELLALPIGSKYTMYFDRYKLSSIDVQIIRHSEGVEGILIHILCLNKKNTYWTTGQKSSFYPQGMAACIFELIPEEYICIRKPRLDCIDV